METTAAESFKPGRYVHYKGGEYVALHLVHHHETRELMVVYLSLERGTANVRELCTPGADSWTDLVMQEGKEAVPRFRYAGPAVDR